jgi:6-phosphogluconolactonase (cycloisomerase 2 family)
MKLSRIGRVSMALVVSVAMGLGMTACGGGTIGFMWVLGTQYNQIGGFKIDDFSGNLTQIPHSPFSSGGADPVSIVVKPGGRFVYVLNHGGSNSTGINPACGTAGSISEFSVGGQGVLTFQQCFQSQGTQPVWAAHDSTGNFLYVLDQQAPPVDPKMPDVLPPYGDITLFSIDPNTGRLTLVLNQQEKDPLTGLQLTYFRVGNKPTMMAVASGCLFTLNSADQTVFPYAAGTGGQLTQTTNSLITTGATNATSIIAGGSGIYITDAGAPGSAGQILPFTVGASSCALNTITGGATANISPASNPVYALVGGTSGSASNSHLYVANQSTTNTTLPNSSISAFNIQSNGQLQPLPQSNNPYPVGAGPVCMVEDPSSQYIYTSNGDGTVTGKSISTIGELSDLKRATTFTTVGQATCLAVSGNVN